MGVDLLSRPLRASSVRDCPRKAAYEATVEPDRDWSDREGRILYRGRSLGRDYADWLAAKYGDDAIEREVKVEWELGVGHIDVFLKPTATALEILSSAHATDKMVTSKLVQLVLYMEHYPAAENGCLIVLNPSDFTEERFPVARDTDAYRTLAEEVHERIARLREWKAGGPLPDRVCRKPSEALGHFCRFADTCFAGWEAPVPAAVTDDPELVHRATLLHVAKAAERAVRDELAEREKERKRLELDLVEQPTLEDGLATLKEGVQVGPFLVKRTHVQRGPSLDLKKAELAGVLNVETLAEYMKAGAEYWTTSIERTELSGPVRAHDFGEEAPY